MFLTNEYPSTMPKFHQHFSLAATVLLSLCAMTGSALADKPDWAGHDKGKHEREHDDKHKHKHKREHEARKEPKQGDVFKDEHRDAVRAYYGRHYAHGQHCPPGLAKKNNGCLPPGQVKYVVGQPVPRGVSIYTVPQPVIVQLPPVPVGYRYVRVGNDIVLLSPKSALIMDVIEGILR